MDEPLVFLQTFEGILRVLPATLEPATLEALRHAGFDPAPPLKPGYPLAVFRGVIDVVGLTIAPSVADADARAFEVGKRFISGYGQTFVGRAMLAGMRLLGPRRTLQQLARQFQTGNNFSRMKVTELAPRRVELWCNEVAGPGFYRGILTAGLELAGARGVDVQLLTMDAAGGTFQISWR